jgi:hypothetical protein
MDEHPIRFAGKRYSGVRKFLIVVIVLSVITLLYVRIVSWMNRAGMETEPAWEPDYPMPEDADMD